MSAIEALQKIEQLLTLSCEPFEVEEVVMAFLMDHDPASRDIGEAWKKAKERMKHWDNDE